MHRYVMPNIVQHGVEGCTKNFQNVGGCLQEVGECGKKHKKTPIHIQKIEKNQKKRKKASKKRKMMIQFFKM